LRKLCIIDSGRSLGALGHRTMNRFEEIYRRNLWGFSSGHGSLPSVTKGYRKFVENFIRNNSVKSVLDFGCGDWQFSRFIDFSNVDYVGVDVVPSLIQENSRKFSKENIKFFLSPVRFSELLTTDLLIVKDVLQHFSNNEVFAFISILGKYKYALITNCVLPEEELNKPIKSGEFRPLDLRKPPFSLNLKEVYSFSSPKKFSFKKFKFYPAWKKLVLLWSRE
jgi:SAM-dependent methyltransferase